MTERIQIDAIRTDGGTQSRAAIDTEHVAELAEDHKGGLALPEIVVFYDGENYWLADGFHRLAAWKSIGLDEARCEVRQGSLRDAKMFSAGANASHGLKRTNADKRRAVMMLLEDEEWSKKSNEWLAEKACVSRELVRTERAKNQPAESAGCTETRLGRDGKERKMPAKKLKSEPPPPPSSQPRSVDDVAEAHGGPGRGCKMRAVGQANAAIVLPLIADGHTQAEVARMTGLSPSVVSGAVARNIRSNPLEKLEAYVDEVEGVISLWSSNFQPKWETADLEQRNALLARVKAMVAAANNFTRRLKESGSPK